MDVSETEMTRNPKFPKAEKAKRNWKLDVYSFLKKHKVNTDVYDI